MDAYKRPINDIFNGNRVLEIPFFQRAYVWGEDQWERLLEDMETVSSENKPYFLGSVILKQEQTSSFSTHGDKRILIDGQQRLTSLSILIKVLCMKTNMLHQFDRTFKLMDDTIALLHNHNDIESFNRVMYLEEFQEMHGADNITGAFNYFWKNASEEKLNLGSILRNVMFVGIDLGPEEDEQQIFDTINSLGVRLTTAELLKNYFFSRDDIENYNTLWKEVFEKDEETKSFWDQAINAGRSKRENIDLFFYSFLQIKVQEPSLGVSGDDKKTYTRVEGLFEAYKHFINSYSIDKAALIAEIKEYAILYRKNIDFNAIHRELNGENMMDRINTIMFGIETTTIIPYVLFILKQVTDKRELHSMLSSLEAFLMRRMVCHATTKNYNQFFTERLIANNIVSTDALRKQIATQEGKINYIPTDEELKVGWHNSKLVNKQALGILYLMESKIRNQAKHSTGLLGLSKYSLEHVMPKKWPNHWSPCSNDEERVNRNRKLLTLGNLTMLTSSLNTSIRDSNWATKKEGKPNKPGLNKYAAGLDTFSAFLKEETWDESVIEQRANFLFEQSRAIWPI